MPPSRLTLLQMRVLDALEGMTGDWALSGGAALAGFHTGHRATRDLDLFWRSRSELGDAREEVLGRLRGDGFEVEIAQSTPAFARLLVRSEGETLVVDLVAEPVAAIEPSQQVDRGGRALRIDSAHEILVNKLCALLHRSELRDLLDVEALLEHGGDLERALADAPRKDGGFSPLTLVWVVRDLPIEAMTRASGLSAGDAGRASAFRDELVERIVKLVEPPR
jgi:hypothetical protein